MREREKNVHCITAGLAGTPADVEIRRSVPEKTNRPFLDFLRRAHRSNTNAIRNGLTIADRSDIRILYTYI